jgi:hypothetical protein
MARSLSLHWPHFDATGNKRYNRTGAFMRTINSNDAAIRHPRHRADPSFGQKDAPFGEANLNFDFVCHDYHSNPI